MSIIILIIIVLIWFFGFATADEPDCAGEGEGCAAPSAVVTIWTPVTVDGIDGVIVAGEDGALFVEAESWWAPTTDDISAAEEAIATGQGLLDHQRQYVGFIEDGERRVLVNGFCDAFGLDWRSQPILVADGGECFFEAVYNVDSGELERFQFNGEA
jgi:hypothetical protein